MVVAEVETSGCSSRTKSEHFRIFLRVRALAFLQASALAEITSPEMGKGQQCYQHQLLWAAAATRLLSSVAVMGNLDGGWIDLLYGSPRQGTPRVHQDFDLLRGRWSRRMTEMGRA
jgi:hypothetical protein